MDMNRQQNHESRPGVVGIFSYLDDVLLCIRLLREGRWAIEHVYSPTPRHEIQAVLDLRTSSIRYFTFVGGAVGALFGLALPTYAHLQWHLITSGKPVLAWIPFFVIAFECCILFGVLSTLLGLSIMTRLPRFRLSDAYDSRFSQDRFGILVSCDEAEQETVLKLLMEAGAEEVRKVGKVN
jgi:molybdopterin-containing oxidoreductase family membrane subunit